MWDTCLLGNWKKFFSPIFLQFYFTAGCFYAYKIKDINLGKPTPRRLYPHITPQKPNVFIIEGYLISNVYTARY